jgi:molybdate transport system substrate-binding protein
MNCRGSLCPAILALVLVFGSWVSAAQTEITLLAPGPIRAPLEKIVASFQAKTNYKVKVTYGTGLSTRLSVAKGETLDVSLIVAPFPGAIASGTIMTSSQTLIASFLTAVAVPKGAPKPDISTPAAVKKALLAAKSIGYEDPDFSTAGQGPTQAISKLGIADQIATKSVLCAGNVTYVAPSVCFAPDGAGGGSMRTVDKWIAGGDVDIAMLYLSAMLPNKDKIDIVGVLPHKICTPTAIFGFVSTHASDPVGAKALLQHLASPEAEGTFKDAGLEPHS